MAASARRKAKAVAPVEDDDDLGDENMATQSKKPKVKRDKAKAAVPVEDDEDLGGENVTTRSRMEESGGRFSSRAKNRVELFV